MVQAISLERLAPYQARFKADSKALGAYAWNVALCESLYPVLNGLEVTLRNSIHDVASTEFGDDYWFDKLELPKSKKAVEKVRSRLANNPKDAGYLSAGRLIAELNFGFWVGLLDSSNEQVLWPKLLKPVFPFATRKQRARFRMSERLHRIRILRNRVFHHEPVWYFADLEELHYATMESIGWMNQPTRLFVETLDRFPCTYLRGPGYYELEILSVIQNHYVGNTPGSGG